MKNEYQAAKIIKIEQETPRVKTFTIDISFEAKPGQYIMLWIPRMNEKPFGVVAPSPLTLSIANVGPFSDKVHQFQVGDTISFRGPFGSSFTRVGKKMLLVGGGYGVVPLYFFASTINKSDRKDIVVILGAKTKTELTFLNRFTNLGVRVECSTDDGSYGYKGFSTDVAQKLLVEQSFDAVYTCGPEVMMRKIAMIAQQQKIPCQVSVERLFKCGGMGICGECSCHGHLVCTEGPVFSSEILSSERSLS